MHDRRLVLSALAFLAFAGFALAAEPTWKAGTAKAVITPEKPMWMAGYGGRTQPAEGKLHDLWIKALALEDADGNRSVVLSSDLLGFPKTVYDNTCRELQSKLGLDRSQIMMTSSHTHCGPVLRGALFDIYPLDDKQLSLIEEYSTKLEKQIVETVETAFKNLAPATLSTGQGITRFAVNRRNNPEAKVPDLREQDALQGPIDHSVPVLAVRSPSGELKAIVFTYACHNTVLGFQQWCGDYSGFAQIELEKKYPGATAMFTMGCGADQNPLPRKTVELCQRYGGMLAGAVEETLRQPMQPVSPHLKTAFEFVDLALDAEPTRAELDMASRSSGAYIQRWAKRLLKQMDEGKPFYRTYPYPIQAWKLGDKQTWIALGGEVVVDYSLRLKKELQSDVWVTGYANDCMAYIPSLRVRNEGGYEGNSSMMVYGVPAHRWGPKVEEQIVESVLRLNQQLAK